MAGLAPCHLDLVGVPEHGGRCGAHTCASAAKHDIAPSDGRRNRLATTVTLNGPERSLQFRDNFEGELLTRCLFSEIARGVAFLIGVGGCHLVNAQARAEEPLFERLSRRWVFSVCLAENTPSPNQTRFPAPPFSECLPSR
jgi:hypothetical protein